MPAEDIIYFGDTARVPYGAKSARTVAQFAREDAAFLLQFDPKLLVVACNTASALALETLDREISAPLVGVVQPGAEIAARLERGPILVLGTEGTVNSQAYPRAIQALRPGVEVISRACPLFVPLAEEGYSSEDEIVRLAVAGYLTPILAHAPRAAVLACTHYPLLHDAIARFLGPECEIIDTGQATAQEARRLLVERGGLSGAASAGTIRYYVSDNPARFRRIGSRFLEHEIGEVEFVEPERYVSCPALDREGQA